MFSKCEGDTSRSAGVGALEKKKESWIHFFTTRVNLSKYDRARENIGIIVESESGLSKEFTNLKPIICRNL